MCVCSCDATAPSGAAAPEHGEQQLIFCTIDHSDTRLTDPCMTMLLNFPQLQYCYTNMGRVEQAVDPRTNSETPSHRVNRRYRRSTTLHSHIAIRTRANLMPCQSSHIYRTPPPTVHSCRCAFQPPYHSPPICLVHRRARCVYGTIGCRTTRWR